MHPQTPNPALSPSLAEAAPDRRIDLDWLRIGAFGLLIFYHIGMFYVTWSWHVKSARASDAIEPLMLAANPWRLDLLFLISGVATRFMADKLSAVKLAGMRFHRLFWPLLFGILVIVPPQSYYELVDAVRGLAPNERLAFTGDWWDFYGKYVTGFRGWCDSDGCLTVPTWNHLWFVAYLLAYTLGLALVWPLLRRLNLRWPAGAVGDVLFLVAPWLVLWLCRATLFPVFDDTHAFVDDWYVHAISGGLFLLGFVIAKSPAPFDAAMRFRWVALGVAIAAFAVMMALRARWGDVDMPPARELLFGRGCRELQAWMAIVALLGFARRHWNQESRLRRYLTEAIFPFYIIHQTAIVVLAYHLDKLRLPLALEASLLIAGAVASCWLGFEIVRRIGVLRPLFGLKGPPPRRMAPAALQVNGVA